jgi:hypothetical protein
MFKTVMGGKGKKGIRPAFSDLIENLMLIHIAESDFSSF